MSRIKAVLCDLDGTLIDSNTLHVAAWDEVFREAGVTVDRAAIAGRIGMGGDNLVPALLPDLDPAARQALADRHGPIYQQHYLARARPFPDARALLARMRAAGQRIVLASSAAADEVEHYIALLDARDLIEATVSSDEVARSKPDPDIFAAAAAKLAPLPLAGIVALGDTPYDVASARAAGIATIGLLSGGFDRAALSGAVAIYRDVADLLAGYDGSPLA